MPTRTLVLIPALNEEEALPGVLADLAAHTPELDVLVIDDGSTDGTAAAAQELGVAVATLPFNLGIGGALRTGFRYAIRNGYDRAVQFDGDGQHDAMQIPTLLRALDEGAELVVGSRFTDRRSTYAVGQVRSRAMALLRLAVRVLGRNAVTDTSSGFRAFSREVLEFFAHTYPAEYMDSVEALLLACYAGFRVVEVPITMRQRAGGRPSNRSLKLLYHYVRLLVVIVFTVPVRGRGSARR